ncbi:TonB-dependent receptor [Sphingomonas parva]|uniref:TonB-dependent receptor n=1 Tax=Sphingomonas parva TaxID=2555898 RepID=A0A4Y8ZR53_9SPHN|nr:TonB-dependent receptor [Sphingomonas parva]TFI58491.1 TonB-dependent receptor [Sphingomonas parva]
MNKFTLLCATTALIMPAAVMAQSTGSVDFEEEAIVVTGSRQTDVAGVQVPETPKAKAVLTDEFIQRQTPGQTVNDIINQLPGVSFTNNDPFGSAGGTLTIRGFDATRISQTFDGLPLNDSGNYALYSNQQVDPELIEQVNVNLGSTDVDSPTAAASGSTVNYRTRQPFEEFNVRMVGSAGSYDFFRTFVAIDTGNFTSFGTRAFVSASQATNNAVFGNRGKIEKRQFNAKIYQPFGDNGDFVSLGGHYNRNRNNFFGSMPLRLDPDRVVGSLSSQRFPANADERDYTVARCQVAAARPGLADTANTCGTAFDERYNPSNTGNVRLNSRFTLAEGLILTVDPSVQFTSANGGGTATGREGPGDLAPGAAVFNSFGYIGGSPYYGRDLNGDGDTRDQVTVLAPSQTKTRRYGVIASLRYDINDDHTARVTYSWDRARHRQTGETGLLQPNGEPFDVFPVNDPLTDVNGNVLQKRDRLSYAILHQVGAEYRGEFLDSRLVVNAGLRAPFFTRDLTNNCFTSSATGFVECFGTNTTAEANYAALNPTVQGPQNRKLKYDAILPNVGFIFDLTDSLSTFANYSKGIQVPGTDNLYNAFFFPANTPSARPTPETTNNFDAGFRYRQRGLLAQISGWYTAFKDRLASAYDPETDRTVYRNLGDVEKYGVDASVSYEFIPNQLSVYAFGSYLWSKIKDDVQSGVGAGGVPIFIDTSGNREGGAPKYTFGGRVQGRLGPVELGVQAKRTGPKFVNDANLPIVQTVGGVVREVYPAKTPAYTIVDLDVRVPLGFAGLSDETFFQLNVTNLFDKFYVGGFTANLENNRVPNAQIGAPRAVIGSINIGF